MGTPDVRIRLSAEGVAEVVSALKTIQAEGSKAAATPTKGFGLLNGVLGNLKGMLAGVGVYFSARAIFDWARGGLQAADAAANLATRLGTTVERASALAWVAKKSDTDIQGLQGSLGRLTRQLAALEDGAPGAIKVFDDIGNLKAPDFKGKDIAQSFGLVATAISKMEPGVRRNNAVLQLFGKSGQQLIPMLNELGNDGLQGVIDKGRQLGVIMSDDAAAAADQLSDQLDTLKTQSQTLAAEFVTGLAPAATDALSAMGQGAARSGSAFRQFGSDIAKVVLPAVALLGSALNGIIFILDAIGSAVAAQAIAITGLAVAGSYLVSGQTNRAKAEIERMKQALIDIKTGFEDRALGRAAFQGGLNTVFLGGDTTPTAPGPTKENAEKLQQAFDARLALERAALDNEVALFKAKTALRNEADKQAWDQGLLSTREYYAHRRKAAEDSAAAEIAALQEQRDLLADDTDDNKRAQDEQKIDAQIVKLRGALTLDLLQLTGEERKAIEDLGEKRKSIEREILEMQGRQREATQQQIEDKIRQYQAVLNALGVASEEQTFPLAAKRNTLEAVADFEEAQRKAQLAMDQVDLARQDIQRQVDAGLLTEIDGQKAIAQLELGRLPNLQDLADKLLACAQATSDPQKILQAQQFVATLKELGTIPPKVSELASALQNLNADIVKAGIDALANSLAGIGTESKNARQALISLASGFAQSVQRILARVLALQAAKAILRSFGASKDLLASVGLSGGGGIEGHAGGGVLRGRGTGISDSILAAGPRGLIRLSNGEYVVRAREVQRPGGLQFLHAYNAGRFDPRELLRTISHGMETPVLLTAASFAGGGAIDDAGSPASASINGKVTIGLEEGLVLRSLDSPEGERLIVKHVMRNRRSLARVLGR